MALHSTFFCILLSVALVFGSGSVPKYTAKVLDFSADIDQEPDSNGEFTSAILDAGPLPDSFTICLAFQVDAWTTVFASARMFEILPRRVNSILESSAWASIQIYTGPGFTEYAAWCSLESYFVKQAATVLPLQWTLACLTLDSNAMQARWLRWWTGS